MKITLNTTGKHQLKQHTGRLPVKLVITPTSGTPTSLNITLNAVDERRPTGAFVRSGEGGIRTREGA